MIYHRISYHNEIFNDCTSTVTGACLIYTFFVADSGPTTDHKHDVIPCYIDNEYSTEGLFIYTTDYQAAACRTRLPTVIDMEPTKCQHQNMITFHRMQTFFHELNFLENFLSLYVSRVLKVETFQ